MAFKLPTFNLKATVFNGYNPPFLPRPAPRLTTECQLRVIRTAMSLNADIATGPGSLLLVPKLTDIRPSFGFGAGAIPGDVIEVPPNSGRFYRVQFVEDIAKGFANEHRVASMIQVPFQGTYPIT